MTVTVSLLLTDMTFLVESGAAAGAADTVVGTDPAPVVPLTLLSAEPQAVKKMEKPRASDSSFAFGLRFIFLFLLIWPLFIAACIISAGDGSHHSCRYFARTVLICLADGSPCADYH